MSKVHRMNEWNWTTSKLKKFVKWNVCGNIIIYGLSAFLNWEFFFIWYKESLKL